MFLLYFYQNRIGFTNLLCIFREMLYSVHDFIINFMTYNVLLSLTTMSAVLSALNLTRPSHT